MSVSTVEPVSRPSTVIRPLFVTLSLIGLITTILLIMVGAIVRVTGNGLGCPDWPLCHGQAIPPFYLSAWVEFVHRLFGGAVVIQVVALIVLAFRHYRHERWIYRTAQIMAVVLTIQVALGGIHVIFELPRWTGWIHTGVAMLVAALVATWAGLTQPGLQEMGRRTAAYLRETRLLLWVSIATVATYLLLLTGSLVTRTGASLVCPSFPYCGLPFVPENLKLIVYIQMTHRLTAFVVAFTITLVLWHLLKAGRRDSGLRKFGLALAGLITLQFSLGMINVWFAIPMWSRVLHLGTAGTIWVVMVMLWVTLKRGQSDLAASTS
ncbi:MAG: heme A synthase [Anaerolineae bacterium]